MLGRYRSPICEGRRVVHDIGVGNAVPHWKDYCVVAPHLSLGQGVKFVLWPLLPKKCFAQDDHPESRLTQTFV